MILRESGIAKLSEQIAEDMRARLPYQRKTQRQNLSLLIATMLDVRSPNTSDLAAKLPRTAERSDMRVQWISRVLHNKYIDAPSIMLPYVEEIIGILNAQKKPIILSMDQSKISDGFEMLMVSLKYNKRALPLLWLVKETSGGIGFKEQKFLLEELFCFFDEDISITLCGDRFYGTVDLITWCQSHNWAYLLRLKSNFLCQASEKDKAIPLSDLCGVPFRALKHALLTHRKVKTHIGILQEKGHETPWIIAMSNPPTIETILDYKQRWSIEPMFSDFKSRGFHLTDTKLQSAKAIETLVLVMSIAMHWAVSIGHYAKKKSTAEKSNP